MDRVSSSAVREDYHPFRMDITWIFLLALSLRVLWVLLVPELDPFLKGVPLLGDAAPYDRLARSLLNGSGFSTRPPYPTSFWAPLYPLFLSVVYTVFGYHFVVGRLSQAILGSLVPVLLYFVALKPFGRRVAVLTGIGLAIYPYLIYFGAWLISEALFLALLATALWLSSRLPGSWRWQNIVILGTSLGLCALSNPRVLFFTPFWSLWILLAPRNKSFWEQLGIMILFVACTFAVILPWSIRNYRIHNQFVLISTNGGYTFLGANNPNAWGGHDERFPAPIPGLNEVQRERAYYKEALDWIQSNPDRFMRLLVHKYRRLFSPLSVASFRDDFNIPGAILVYIVYGIFLLVALIGAAMGFRYWRDIGFLYAPILGVLLATGLFYGDVRYSLPMAPSLVLFSALTLESGWLMFRERVGSWSERSSAGNWR